MTIQGAAKGFGVGFLADMFLGPMVTGGMGKFLGAIYGLFKADAGGMNRAYDSNRFSDAPRKFGTMGMFSSIFGNSEGRPNDPRARKVGGSDTSIWKTVGALAIGAGLFTGVLGNFGLPLFFAGLAPYNAGGLVPLAWSSGMMPSWGWGAGIWC